MACVLVIDDDRPIRELIARLLDRSGHEVVAATNGLEGLEAIAGAAIDLVITDINMPDMDGIEVIVKLREESPDLPIIAISGGGLMPQELLLESAEGLGAVEVVDKPFEAIVLMDAVERALSTS